MCSVLEEFESAVDAWFKLAITSNGPEEDLAKCCPFGSRQLYM
jgi:hypothetical protein